MRIVVGILVVTVLIVFYFVCWKLNKRLNLPEGIKGDAKKCNGCGHTSCNSHPTNKS